MSLFSNRAEMQWSLFVIILMGQSFLSTCRLYEYHFINENKTWEEAQKYCRQHYTDLATVSDMADMKRLNDSAQHQHEAWIGLHNITGEENRVWHWSLPGIKYDSSEDDWDDEEPNDNGGKNPENCVRMDDEEWKDVPCSEPNHFICYDEETSSSEKFHCIKTKMTWLQAQSYCREKHTDLISGRRQLKEFDDDSKSESPMWIGLFRDTWRWSDQSNSSFRNWDPESFKDEQDKNCSVILPNGKWSSDKCDDRKPFFCYDDKVILISENKTWEQALDYCREKHRDLVSITNHHQQRWVQERAKRANSDYVWLGLRYTCTLDLWFWVNDMVVCYENWASEEKTEQCDRAAAMKKEGQKWVEQTDSKAFNFICAL